MSGRPPESGRKSQRYRYGTPEGERPGSDERRVRGSASGDCAGEELTQRSPERAQRKPASILPLEEMIERSPEERQAKECPDSAGTIPVLPGRDSRSSGTDQRERGAWSMVTGSEIGQGNQQRNSAWLSAEPARTEPMHCPTEEDRSQEEVQCFAWRPAWRYRSAGELNRYDPGRMKCVPPDRCGQYHSCHEDCPGVVHAIAHGGDEGPATRERE
jgi:hypothetical protein